MININFAEINNCLRKNSINLNKQQCEAVLHVNGPAIVLAVPGAGKTTTMVVRIHNLVQNNGVAPENILTMTFSKASARDMRRRYITLFGDSNSEKLVFSTIHSFALSVIRNFERKNHVRYQIIEGDSNREKCIGKAALLKAIFKKVNNRYITEDEMDVLTNELGLVKNKLLTKKELLKLNCSTPKFGDIYQQYETFKNENNYIDFDDMLTFALDILHRDTELLVQYQKQYRYVLVDEGQDTSFVQHELIKTLVKPDDNLFLVADDDQSIYGFRGAEPGELMSFSSKYPKAVKYFIESNYRSTENIVCLSNEFIKVNCNREEKNMITNNKKSSPVCLVEMANELEQVNYICNYITKELGTSDGAILFRNNLSAVLLVDELYKQGVHFSMRDRKLNFFKNWIVMDIKCFLHFSLDPCDLTSFEKIYYRMEAYLPKAALDLLKEKHTPGVQVIDFLGKSYRFNNEQLLRLQNLTLGFKRINLLSPMDSVEWILSEMNYQTYLKKYCRENNVSEFGVDEILFILKQIARKHSTIVQFLNHLYELEAVIADSTYKDGSDVILSTIHGVKGLEFEHVIMMDLVEGKLPSGESLKRYEEQKDLSLLEEEARLFYVGMTRAKTNLVLMTTTTRSGKKASPSRYYKRVYELVNPGKKLNVEGSIAKLKNRLSDAYKNTGDIHKGDRIKHSYYGLGVVTSIDRGKLFIKFENGKENVFPQSAAGKYIINTEK